MEEIYYLLEFHHKCGIVATGPVGLMEEYCGFVNVNLHLHFTEDEQKQLRMHNFDETMLNKFAYEIVYGIHFDNLDKRKLEKFFTACLDY